MMKSVSMKIKQVRRFWLTELRDTIPAGFYLKVPSLASTINRSSYGDWLKL
jgi:hypothetical protein